MTKPGLLEMDFRAETAITSEAVRFADRSTSSPTAQRGPRSIAPRSLSRGDDEPRNEIDCSGHIPGTGTDGAGAAARASLLVMDDAGVCERTDWIVVEEPLEIRAHGPGQSPASVAVTMRTPGNDAELAVGFLYTEGLIVSRGEIVTARECVRERGGACNVVEVALSRPFDSSVLKRNFFATSSCGVCGKATLDQIAVRCPAVGPGPVIGHSVLVALPNAMREAQAVFDRTGGLHAAGLFDAAGQLICLREDVGRHNAVDKLVGRALLDGELPLAGRIMLVSGRTSFEILQKAASRGRADRLRSLGAFEPGRFGCRSTGDHAGRFSQRIELQRIYPSGTD